MVQARTNFCIIVTTFLIFVLNLAPSQAQLSPACSVNVANNVVTCNYVTSNPLTSGNFIYQVSPVPADAVVLGPLPSSPPGFTCYYDNFDQTNPYDIACVQSEIDGILTMIDSDAGVKQYVPAWGNTCWVIPYALFYSPCPATCTQCVNGRYLIADASAPLSPRPLGGGYTQISPTPNINEGFTVEIPPGGQAICGVTAISGSVSNLGSPFIDFGNNVTYGQDVPGICNDNVIA